MYKNLNPDVLGVVAVRQSELIELTLSYGFAGFTIDLSDFESQVKHGSLEHTGRLIASAKLSLGAFELPIDSSGNDEAFATEKGRLIRLAAAASQIGAEICRITIPAANDSRPYQEQFEFCRKRLTEIAKILAAHDLRLAVGFESTADARSGAAYQFLHTFDELVKLVENAGEPNVGLCLDTWHWHTAGGDASQLAEIPADKVFAVDLADSTEPAGNDSVDESARRLPGEGGHIDTVAVLKWLAENDFAGPITPVPSPESFGEEKREEILKHTSRALLRQWIEAGLSDEEMPPDEKPPEATDEADGAESSEGAETAEGAESEELAASKAE